MKQDQPSLNTRPAAALCPNCAQENQCAVAAGEPAGNCWCMTTAINPALAKRYAGQQRCLCPQCGQITQR
ncbi:MAG TPA: hypothetical protein DIW43_03980 [Spongiibacteraceae bacterium]|nr:hypothetical protein [Spongiibacteraceae bacterium]HCS26586.1 hypothetical protein [Spongiibacteraceae bacterium]